MGVHCIVRYRLNGVHFNRSTLYFNFLLESPPPLAFFLPVYKYYTSRKTALCAPDHVPLCYHYGEANHTYQHCQYCEMGLRGFAMNMSQPQSAKWPCNIASYITGTQWELQRPFWSLSPCPTQSQSYSPYPGNTAATVWGAVAARGTRRNAKDPPFQTTISESPWWGFCMLL